MALELTHVRFADALAPHLDIQNEADYIAGAIYPDSRYVTGIQRELTHEGKSPQDPFAAGLSDFEKGWATHLLYDHYGHKYYFDLMSYTREEISGLGPGWQQLSAIKAIEDMASYQVMGETAQRMQNITFPTFPNDEDEARMQIYADLQRDLYKQEPTAQTYGTFVRQFIQDEAVCQGLEREMTTILADKQKTAAIHAIFDTIVEEVLTNRK